MANFPHLRIKQSLDAKYKPPRGGGGKKSPITTDNLNNRSAHGNNLLNQANQIIDDWANQLNERVDASLPPLPEAIPLFLKIDSDKMDIDSLRSFGIEIISIEDDGVIIGSSVAGDLQLISLKEKILKFLNETGRDKNQAAQLWEIETGKSWRLENILSESLLSKWNSISETEIYVVDLGISCNLYISKFPAKKKGETDNKYNSKLTKWQEEKKKLEMERDEISFKRQRDLENLVLNNIYEGKILTGYIDFGDSFGVRIQINGKGLKDLVFNFPYLFEVNEYDPYGIDKISEDALNGEDELEITSPNINAPRVCVIDSGIQEKHKYLVDAILEQDSKSYLPGNTTVMDLIQDGGHGTRVAGAVLFSNVIPKSGKHSHFIWIQNARILDEQNNIPYDLYPPELMRRIVGDYIPLKTKIFNLSVNSNAPCRLKHMSDWAASLDVLNWENDVLFIVSAGNLKRQTRNILNPGIKDHLEANRDYPSYLNERSSRIANPAQSFFSLTVGSISLDEYENTDLKSFGKKDEPSSFSRTGLGIWGSIKPDVVEYGGDWVREKKLNPNLSIHPSTSPELTRTTIDGGPGISRDMIGTSFAAPKVSHIAARILSQWSNASSVYIRALIAQSARWSEKANNYNPLNSLRYFGYGLPSLERALENSKSRITFVAENIINPRKAHIYSFRIPEELRSQADSHRFILEVSLAYKAKIRRTRKGSHSYVSTWVDWISGNLGESEEVFKEKVTDYISSEVEEFKETETPSTIKWTIRERKDWGRVVDAKRNDSSLQKDWAYLYSYELTDVINFAVVGHSGWERDLEEGVPYCIFISLECLNSEISVYEPIRVLNRIEIEV